MPSDRILLAQLDVSIRGLEKTMARAGLGVDSATNRMEKRWNRMSRNIEKRSDRMASDIRRAIAAIGLGIAGREVIAYGDTWVDFQNKLAAASKVAGIQATTLGELQASAREARADLEGYVDLYSRILRSSKGVANSQEEVAKVTNLTAKAFAAGGASASEQAAGVLQLGQALGSGFLQGDELRSLRENAPLVAKAIADSLGVSIGGLKELGAQGELTSAIVFDALLSAEEDIESAFGATVPRATEAARRAIDDLSVAVGEYMVQSGALESASSGFAAALGFVSSNMEALANAAIIGSAALGGFLGAKGLIAVAAGLNTVAVGATASAKALALLRGVTTFLGGPWVIAFTVAAAAVAALVVRAKSAKRPVEELTEKLSDTRDALKEIAENAGADWDVISGGARDAIGPVTELERHYAELRDRIKETGAAARQAAIDAAAIQRIEAVQARGDAEAAIGAIKSKRDNRRAGNAGRVASEIAALESVMAEADKTIAQASATIDYLFTQTENADFKIEGRDAASGGAGGAGSGENIAGLERAFQIELARAEGNQARLQFLRDAAEIEKRTADYIKASVAPAEARIKAEKEVAALRQANLNNELDGLLAESAELFRERVEAAKELAAAQAAALAQYDLELALQKATLEGDKLKIAELERELAIRERMAELEAGGIVGTEARDRAASEVDEIRGLEVGRDVREAMEAEREAFRDVFSSAVQQAMADGNVGDAIKSVFAERAADGLRDALNSLADTIFDLFKGVFDGAGGANGAGDWGGIGDVVSSWFGGGREHGGPVDKGKIYEVNEKNKPETLESGGKKYLLPGRRGMVSPMQGMAGPRMPGRGAGPVSLNSPLIVQGNVTEEAMPMVQRAIAENNERVMAALPRAIRAEVSSGVTRGRYG